MKPKNVLFFDSRAEFRAWLDTHHATADHQWLGFYKKNSGRAGLSYDEAIEEALCFGWIDGQGGPIDDQARAIRFTPRRKDSIWSNVNIARMEQLLAEGHVQPAGMRAFEARRDERTGLYSHDADRAEFSPELEVEFRTNGVAWDFWNRQPPSYRRQMTWWVVSARRDETRRRRLDVLIEEHEARRRIDPLHMPRMSER